MQDSPDKKPAPKRRAAGPPKKKTDETSDVPTYDSLDDFRRFIADGWPTAITRVARNKHQMSWEDAEELTNDVLLRVYKGLSDNKAFKPPLIFGLIRFAWLDTLKKKGRQITTTSIDNDEVADRNDRTFQDLRRMGDDVLDDDLRLVYRPAVDQVEEKGRTNKSELAKLTGLSPPTIVKRLKEAMTRVAKEL